MANKFTKIFSVAAFLMLVCAGCEEKNMFKGQQSLYVQVVNRIKTGEIKPDNLQPSNGSVRLPESASLPPDVRNASTDGEIYIFRRPPAQLIIVFKTWRGKGFNMEGYLYAATPLGPQDTSKDAYGKKNLTLGPMNLEIKRQINTNWYQVSYKLD